MWGQVWVILGSSQQGPRQAACSGRCSEPGRGHGPQAAPSSPPPPPPTCQLLKLQGRAHREGPGCQGAWAPSL